MVDIRKECLITYLKQSFCSARMLFGILAIPCFMFLLLLGDFFSFIKDTTYNYSGMTLNTIYSFITNKNVLMIIPIICTIPYSSSLTEDFKNNHFLFSVHRCGKKNYLLTHFLSCIISGGTVVLIGFAAFSIITEILIIKYEPEYLNLEIAYPYLKNIIRQLVLFFFSGAFWSLFGMGISSLIKSTFISYISPFIVFYLLVILSERYFTWLTVLNPQNWILTNEKCFPGFWYVLLVLIELIFLEIIFNYFAMERKIDNV